MEEKIINMNQFLGAAQGDQEHLSSVIDYIMLDTSNNICVPFCISADHRHLE